MCLQTKRKRQAWFICLIAKGKHFTWKKNHGNQKTLPGEVSSSAEVKDMSVCKPSEQEIVARVSGLGKRLNRQHTCLESIRTRI